MANVQLQDILNTARFLMAEPNNQGRFSDAELTNYANMATAQVMVRVEWPQATFSLTSDGVSKEYPLPECNAILRVYVAGQEAVPTSIPLLQGDPIGVLDMSTSVFAPQWTQAPFTGYPVGQSVSQMANNAVPYFQGQRPGFYLDRGGYIGFVPPPTAGWSIAIDGFPVPSTLVNGPDTTFFPFLFKECLAWQTLTYAYFAEGTQAANSSMQLSSAEVEKQIKEILIPWKKNFNRNLPNQPMPMPHRRTFRGPYRGPQSGGRFGS